MMRKEKYAVYGEFGGRFTNLKEAKKCARFCSTREEHNFESEVYLISDGCSYIDYEDGKCVCDRWTIRKGVSK